MCVRLAWERQFRRGTRILQRLPQAARPAPIFGGRGGLGGVGAPKNALSARADDDRIYRIPYAWSDTGAASSFRERPNLNRYNTVRVAVRTPATATIAAESASISEGDRFTLGESAS